MITSATTKHLNTALLNFQKDMPIIRKDTTNPFFKKNYAPLDNIQGNAHPILHKYGLTYTQHPEGENKLTTRIIHAESDEWMESEYSMTATKVGPQETGSLISYMKRYSLQAILGIIVADEDDDGNKAQGKQQEAPPAVSEQERSRIVKEINKYTDVEALTKYFTGLEVKYQTDEGIRKAGADQGAKLKKPTS